jgi:hypothetical protein
MKSFRSPLLLVGALTASACHDSDSDARAFAPFVTDLIQTQTSDSAAPVVVAGQAFAFSEDPAAFDAVLPNDDGPVVEQ